MLKTVASLVSVSILAAGTALAAPGVDVKVNAPPPPGVNVQIGTPAPPRIVEKERVVVVKDKKDQGKHKGHYKQKKHKKH